MPPVFESTSHIANKQSRAKALKRQKHLKAQAKLARRAAQRKAEDDDPSLRAERLAKNPPRTIEGERKWLGDEAEGKAQDPGLEPAENGEGSSRGDARTRPVAVEVVPPTEGGEEEELKLDLGTLSDLFSSYPPEDPSQPPPRLPVLITTSPRPSEFTLAFCDELAGMFGGRRHATVIKRKTGKFGLGKVCNWATGRGYGSLVVIGEDAAGRNRSGPTHLTMSRLPYGPTAHFRLTNITPGKAIKGHANPTSHFPELVLSNFSTPLGLSVGRLLQSVFPPLPDLEGRQVVSVQNQRDFIFFRRFRYAFAERAAVLIRPGEENIRTRLQEIGPRFTVKLRYLKRGTLAGGANVNVLPGGEGKERSLAEIERQREGSRKAREAHEKAKARAAATWKGKEPLQEATARDNGEDTEMADADGSEPTGTGQDEAPDGAAPTSAAAEPVASPPKHSAPPPTAPAKAKKRKRRGRSSANVQEAFLAGDSDSDPDATAPKSDRAGGGLQGYMRTVEDRIHGRDTGKKKREVEWEWKARMGKDRKTFFL